MSRLTALQREQLLHVQAEVSGPKSRLIGLLRELERAGIDRKAARPDRIIGELEKWQNP